MVIPASMNQIHGGVQLIRLVLTSISTLMIKTLQTLSPSIHQAGGPRSPRPGHTQLWDLAVLKR